MPDTPDAWEQSLSQTRSEAAEKLIHELRMQIDAGRSSTFNRTFLGQIDDNPQMTIRQCWETVENYFAQQNRVRPRQYPFLFDN